MTAKEENELLIARSNVSATTTGVLSGFMFTATIFLVQYRTMPLGDLFLFSSALLTILFVFTTVAYPSVADYVGDKDLVRARTAYDSAEKVGGTGFLGVIAFMVGLVVAVSFFAGLVLVLATVCIFVYFLKKAA